MAAASQISVYFDKVRDGGFIPPAVRTVVLSRSRIDKLFSKDGGVIPLAYYFMYPVRMVV